MCAGEQVLHIVQDHESIVQFLDVLCCSIENDRVDVPNYVPMLNDGLMSDKLSKLAEFVKERKDNGECEKLKGENAMLNKLVGQMNSDIVTLKEKIYGQEDNRH